MKTPEILFKYLDHRGLDLLTNRRVRAKPPNKLNDPFEFTLVIEDNPTDCKIWGKISHYSFLQELWKGYGRPIPYENFRRHFFNNREYQIAEHRKVLPKAIESYLKEFNESSGEASTLTCFSRRNDGILLWSHYADGHTGFVVGFDVPILLSLFGRDDGVLVEVLYRKMRPKICLCAKVEERNIVRRIVGTKSREWKYEEEYRLIILRENLEVVESEKTEKDLFLSIKGNEQVVRSVIIGSRCDPKLRDSLAAVLAEPAFKHVETFEAIPDQATFSIHIKPIKLH